VRKDDDKSTQIWLNNQLFEQAIIRKLASISSTYLSLGQNSRNRELPESRALLRFDVKIGNLQPSEIPKFGNLTPLFPDSGNCQIWFLVYTALNFELT